LRVGGAEKKRRSKKQAVEAEPAQLALLDMPGFQQGIESAVAQAHEIEEMKVTAAADVHAQEAAYAKVREELNRKYGRLADLWVARSFGVAVDGELWDRLIQYGLTNSIEIPHAAELIRQAQAVARQRRFFHWELEFPEVFFDRNGRPSREKAGFSVIFGNPPYVCQERLADQKDFFTAAFPDVYSGIADLYVYFVAQGLKNLAADGLLGFIAANKWLRADYAAQLRSHLLAHSSPIQLLDFGHSDVFEGTDTFPCILILEKHAEANSEQKTLLFADVSDQVRGQKPLHSYVHEHGFAIPYAKLRRAGWVLKTEGTGSLLDRLQTEYPKLGQWQGMRALRGIITGLNEAFYVDDVIRNRLIESNPKCGHGSSVISKLPKSHLFAIIGLSITERKEMTYGCTTR